MARYYWLDYVSALVTSGSSYAALESRASSAVAMATKLSTTRYNCDISATTRKKEINNKTGIVIVIVIEAEGTLSVR